MPWIPASSGNWKRPASSTQSGQGRSPPRLIPGHTIHWAITVRIQPSPEFERIRSWHLSMEPFPKANSLISNFDHSIETHNKNGPKDDLKNTRSGTYLNRIEYRFAAIKG